MLVENILLNIPNFLILLIRKKILLLSLATIFFVGAGCVSIVINLKLLAMWNLCSSDRGDSWQIISNLVTAEGIKSISNVNIYKIFTDPQDPQAMYLGTRENGLFYTYDGGRSWQRPASSAVSNGFIYSIAVHPQDKCTIMATNGDRFSKLLIVVVLGKKFIVNLDLMCLFIVWLIIMLPLIVYI